eukprot:scaffold1034_cov418-Prasinococcus_capsulatus_cf.AAC.27
MDRCRLHRGAVDASRTPLLMVDRPLVRRLASDVAGRCCARAITSSAEVVGDASSRRLFSRVAQIPAGGAQSAGAGHMWLHRRCKRNQSKGAKRGDGRVRRVWSDGWGGKKAGAVCWPAGPCFVVLGAPGRRRPAPRRGLPRALTPPAAPS